MTWEDAILIQRKQDIYTQLGVVTCIPNFIGVFLFYAFWYFFKYSVIKKGFFFKKNKRFTLE